MSKKIPELNLVPGGVLASNLFFEVARQISANTYNGESERIAADTLIALLTNAGAAININLISTLTPTNAAWDSTRTYTPYDYLDVAYQGKHYVYSPAKQPSAGHLPTEADYWILIASDGAVGAVGPAGPAGQSITGPAGPAGTPGTAGTNGTNGISAIATTTGTPPAIPAVGSSADYAVNSTAGLIAQQYYGFGGIAGTLQITAIPNTTTVTLQNVDATAGASVAPAVKLAPVGKTGTAGTGGGASGIQYLYNTNPGSGVISAADLTTATSLTINATDASGKTAADVLGRLKIDSIFNVAKDATNWVRYKVTSDYASGSVGVSVQAFLGSIAASTLVYLGIVSDAPSSLIAISPAPITASSLDSFGDSITAGTGASATANRYVNLVAANTGWTLTNHGVGGTRAPDGADLVYAANPSNSTQYVLAFGYNDLINYGTNSAGQSTFTDALTAEAAWLAVPSTKRVKGQDSAITYSGAWSNASNYGGSISKSSSAAGNTATYSFNGDTLLIGYTRLASGTGTFAVAIDGASPITVTGQNAVATDNGRTYSPALKIISGLSQTHHTAVITVSSGTVNLDWLAGISASAQSYTGPNVFLGNIIRVSVNAYGTPPSYDRDALVGTYNDLIRTAAASLQAVGLKINPVNENAAWTSTNVYSDAVHPNDAGHAEIAQAFINKIRLTSGLGINGAGGGGTGPDLNILSDTFTAADGTTIIGKYTAAGQPAWYKWNGTSNGSVVGNKAGWGGSNFYAARTYGLASYTLTADLTFGSSIGVILRGSTTQNTGILFALDGSFAYLYDAPAYTQIVSAISKSLSSGTSHTFSATVSSTNILISLDGATLFNVSTTAHNTDTGIGFVLNSANDLLDNWSVA